MQKKFVLRVLLMGTLLYTSFTMADSHKNLLSLNELVGSLKGATTNLDPAHISFNAQWHTITNLGINLISYDSESRLIPMASDSWSIDSNFQTFKFKLNKQIKDSSGQLLTSDDWKATFEHLLSSSGSTHSFISDVLESNGILTPYPDQLELRLKKPYKTLLHRLASPEFILIPKKSIDKATNKVNFRISSGPYFVAEKNEEKQEVTLQANIYFNRYTDKQPKKVRLVPFKGDAMDLFEAVSKGKINFALASVLPTDRGINGIKDLISKNEINAEVVNPSSTAFIVFGENTWLTVASKLFLTKIFFESAKNQLTSTLSSPARQFFPPHLNGSLSAPEEEKLFKKLQIKATQQEIKKKLIIYSSTFTSAHGLAKWVSEVLEKNNIKAEVHDIDAMEFQKNKSNIVYDLYIVAAGVNSKDPAGSLLDLVSAKGGLISDTDHKLLNFLQVAGMEQSPTASAALESLSKALILEAKIIPILHYGTTIISDTSILAKPPTLFDDELQLNSIRWK